MKNFIVALFLITFTLSLGEYPTYVKNIGLLNYAGMVNQETFSLIYRSNGGDGNRFYPINSSIISIEGKKFKVLKVTPTEILLDSIL